MSHNKNGLAFDYIVVGAGSAGCVVANRLSADPSATVLLLEAGPVDKNMWIHIPAGVLRVMADPKVTWPYFTEAEPGLKGRKLFWPRGKTLGGTSAVNGMAYMRGQPEDFALWTQLGCQGWSWGEVLPHFRETEDSWRGADGHHGAGEGVQVTNTARRQPAGSIVHWATQAFIDGGLEAGLRYNDDFNGPTQERIGWIEHTITGNGRRHTTATAFLKPLRDRANLEVWTEALVDQIEIKEGRATGVTLRRAGAPQTVSARREIILCGGTINSPQTLMLSGVGPAEHLKAHGIAPLVDSPMVGENLQDHMYVHWVHEVREGYSFNRDVKGPRLLPHVLRYFMNGRGLLTTGASSGYIFCKTLPGAETPDTQIGFRAMSDEAFVSGTPGRHDFPGWSASVCYLRPKSRGRIRLKSARPEEAPAIQANYLDHDDDLAAIMKALRLVERIYATPKIKDILVKRLAPAEGVDMADDAALEDYVRASGNTMYHPVGTCMMGAEERSVLDPRLRVRGVEGLRVADASIMPTIVSGNTNAPAIMIGAKAAHMVIEDGNRQ